VSAWITPGLATVFWAGGAADPSDEDVSPKHRHGGRTAVLEVPGYPAGINRDIVAGSTYTSSAPGDRSRTSCERANISSWRRTSASPISSGS
jgi:hypothetical protein